MQDRAVWVKPTGAEPVLGNLALEEKKKALLLKKKQNFFMT